jgi:aquaporin Z
MMEAFLTFLLVTVTLSVATRHKVVGPTAALASGGTVALCGLFAKPVSGASMNPARSLGPAVVSGSAAGVWLYVVGPLAGGLLAVIFTRLLHGRRQADEHKAAQGEGTKATKSKLCLRQA